MGLLIEYYANLFTTSNPYNLERILEGVQSVVTEEMRVALARPFVEGPGIGWDATLILLNLLD